MKKLFILLLVILTVNPPLLAQNYTSILGRPTKNSITLNVLFDKNVDVYITYGLLSTVYSHSTGVFSLTKDEPTEITLEQLIENTRYFYQIAYREAGANDYTFSHEQQFHTWRPESSTFSFAIEADPHLDTNSIPDAYTLTLENIHAKKPDFLIDLGDTFMSEKLTDKTQPQITARHVLFRPYLNIACQSAPLFLVLGNHEGEQGWQLDGTPDCLPVMACNTRKRYYSNPIPNEFYTGDNNFEPFVGQRQSYYAWKWGNALFIVLDPYWYTTQKPDWGWTLGQKQYEWFTDVIQNNPARFKFVFCHHLLGGNGKDARGGMEYANFFEMGGLNADSTWGFSQFRSGWQAPIHTLMVDNGASIFFHGHDHFFGKQVKDGVVYQEVPQPSNRNLTNTSATKYGYVIGDFLPGRGFLNVTVSDSVAKVEYIRTYLPNETNGGHVNGEIAYSYTIKSGPNATDEPKPHEKPSIALQAKPNPLSYATILNYSLTNPDYVQIMLIDMFGNKQILLNNSYHQPGNYELNISKNAMGLSKGIYICSLSTANQTIRIKILVNE